MSLNKNFTPSLIYKLVTCIVSLTLILTLLLSFSPVVLAQPTTPPARPAQTTPRPTTPASGTISGNAKPVDLCADFIDGTCLGGTDQYATGDGRTIITSLTTNIVSLLIFIGAAIAVFFIVLGGYKVITSNGDDKTAKEGKDMVFNSIIGLVIIMLSYTIITVVTGIISNLNIGK